MNLRIETKHGIIEASSKHAGRKTSRWGADENQHNIVTLRFAHHEDIEVVGEEEAFYDAVDVDFWGSQVNPELDTEYDLGNAIMNILSDANYSNYDYEDFCSELGYEPYKSCGHCRDTKSSEVYEACVSLRHKLPMPGNEDFLCDIINELSENYS